MKFLTRRTNEWLIVIGLFLLVSMAMGYIIGTYVKSPMSWNNLFSPVSTQLFLSHGYQNAIALFAGDALDPIPIQTYFITFIGVVIYLILGPWLLYHGFISSRKNEEYKKPWQWYVGAIICIGSMSILPTTSVTMIVMGNTAISADKSRETDKLREEAFDVGFKLAQEKVKQMSDFSLTSFEKTYPKEQNLEIQFDEVVKDSLYRIITKSGKSDLSVQVDVQPYEEDFLLIRN
ncbi:MAG: hypothetical protein JJ966_15425 [Balneolaceae bacterium]|nr:hypothetical protein [Balneolaceae bacterium]